LKLSSQRDEVVSGFDIDAIINNASWDLRCEFNWISDGTWVFEWFWKFKAWKFTWKL